VNDKPISIRYGGSRLGDQRCKRIDCIFPQPTVRFDLEGRRIVAAWSWLGVRVVNASNGVRVKVVPTLLLVPLSCS
jgi:hypothetical protein